MSTADAAQGFTIPLISVAPPRRVRIPREDRSNTSASIGQGASGRSVSAALVSLALRNRSSRPPPTTKRRSAPPPQPRDAKRLVTMTGACRTVRWRWDAYTRRRGQPRCARVDDSRSPSCCPVDWTRSSILGTGRAYP